MNKVYLTWEQINELLDRIHDQVGDKVGKVTGIPRGGIILAVLYSHKFKIPYQDYRSNIKDLLILDDISDSGETVKQYKTKYPDAKLATLYYKENSIGLPDYYGKKIPQDFGWIVYPWERKDSNTVQDYLDNWE